MCDGARVKRLDMKPYRDVLAGRRTPEEAARDLQKHEQWPLPRKVLAVLLVLWVVAANGFLWWMHHR